MAVVLPVYNAAATLEATVGELPSLVDHRILVDDGSRDGTVRLARELGLSTFVHDSNDGYGRNQMTCYREVLRAGVDIVVMVHPDDQDTPRLVTAMASMIAYDVYDVVGSRIRRHRARRWHAALQGRVEPAAHGDAERHARCEALRGPHIGTARLGAACSRRCRSSRTPTISCSTTRCSRSVSISASASARCRARRSTSPRHRH
ncbi:MAG: glycosyltransferase [Vicinamibacterales bacterium]